MYLTILDPCCTLRVRRTETLIGDETMAKKYHLPTSPENKMRVNVEQNRFAAAFICNAGPWTPAMSKELDERMAVLFPTDEDKDVCEPDEAVLAAMEAEEEPEEEPPPSLFC
jgi:hypothetical protein